MTTTWNSSDKSGISLSTDDLTATITTTNNNGIRSTTSRSSGKAYLEFTFGQVSNGFTFVGCANSSWDETQVDSLGRDANSFSYQSNGFCFIANDNSHTNIGDSFTVGDTVQLCIDFDAKLYWCTKNNDGNWNGVSANPAAGTGGYDFSVIAGPYFVAYCSANTGDNTTVNFGASPFSFTAPTGFSAWGSGSSQGTVPAAVAGTNWTKKADWSFGSNAAPSGSSQIQTVSDFQNAGWENDTGTFGVETAVIPNTPTDNHWQLFNDHIDMVVIYTGGTPSAGNGSITTLLWKTQTPKFSFSAAPGYYEGTFKIPQGTSNDNANSNHLLTGSWPGWWMVGWDNVNQIATWGPEIDTFEFFGTTDKGPTDPQFHLHDNGTNPTLCFESGGTQQGQFVPHVIDTTNVTFLQEALGGFSYSPGTDYSAGYHRFGTKIDSNYNVELWIDDVKVGHFTADQYAQENGSAVFPQLTISFAAGASGGNVDTSTFGGLNNTGPSNQWRFSIQRIQLWGP